MKRKPYQVVLLPKAEQFFSHTSAPIAKKLAKCFCSLEADPFHHPNVKPLVGPLKGFLRFRAGDYRVIYRVVAESQTVYVVRIAHRKEAY